MAYKSEFERIQWIGNSQLQDTIATGYLSRNIDLMFVILFYLRVIKWLKPLNSAQYTF